MSEPALDQIELLVLDVDGVLTDGRLLFDADGREQKVFNVRDGYGIKALQRAGIAVAVITGRRSTAVEKRIAELGIAPARLGEHDKGAAMRAVLTELGVDAAAVACMGDDVPDLPMLNLAGLAICPSDAHADVRAEADWITERAGGDGAVREVCDALIAATSPA